MVIQNTTNNETTAQLNDSLLTKKAIFNLTSKISCITFVYSAVTKSGTGTWDGDVGLGTRGRGTRGRDKQTTPNICAEFVEYNFRWSRESYFMLESLLVVADGFQRPWFGRTFLLAYLTVRTLGTE